MSDEQEKIAGDKDESGLLNGKAVSRRDFLKIAGIAGATIGVGAGLGGLVAACGRHDHHDCRAHHNRSRRITTTTAAPSSSTTVTTGATAGREVKLGFVTPQTGALASFGVADKYCVDLFKTIVGAGMVLGDGQMHPISVDPGGQPIQRQPLVSGRRRPDPEQQGRHPDGGLER